MPTTAELRTAIEVLRKLGERINEHAAHAVMQLPDTRLGDDYAMQLEARTIGRITHIEAVTTQLKNWRDELIEQKRQHVSQSV